MAVGLNADTEYLRRSSIPGSGNAGRLCDGGFKNTFQGVWLYRPSATATQALTAGGGIIQLNSAAREVRLGFSATGATLADVTLQVTFNSGGGAGSEQNFGAHNGDDYLDEWVYYFILDNSTSGQIAGYIRLADLTTVVSLTRANDNASSQYINTLTFGNASTSIVVLGHYAYARARFATGITVANVQTWAGMDTPDTGDWGFWPLDTNTDTADDSGNSRDLTFNGTLTTETSPTLGGATGYELIAESGSIAISGISAILAQNRSLTSQSGSIAISGISAILAQNRSLTSQSGSIEINGTNIEVRHLKNLTAQEGLIAVTGIDAGVQHSKNLVSQPGLIDILGENANLLLSEKILTAQPGAISVTGVPANLSATLVVVAQSEIIPITGISANLTKSGYYLDTIPAAIAIIGLDANLRFTYFIEAQPGIVSIAGVNANLNYGRYLEAQPSGLLIVGIDADVFTSLPSGFELTALEGSVPIFGQNASLQFPRQLVAQAGVMSIMGVNLVLWKANQLISQSGTVPIIGTDVLLIGVEPGAHSTDLIPIPLDSLHHHIGE